MGQVYVNVLFFLLAQSVRVVSGFITTSHLYKLYLQNINMLTYKGSISFDKSTCSAHIYENYEKALTFNLLYSSYFELNPSHF